MRRGADARENKHGAGEQGLPGQDVPALHWRLPQAGAEILNKIYGTTESSRASAFVPTFPHMLAIHRIGDDGIGDHGLSNWRRATTMSHVCVRVYGCGCVCVVLCKMVWVCQGGASCLRRLRVHRPQMHGASGASVDLGGSQGVDRFGTSLHLCYF